LPIRLSPRSVGAGVALIAAAVAVGAAPALAYHADFCDRLVAQTSDNPPHFNCAGPEPPGGLTFVSVSYPGSGNIAHLRADLESSTNNPLAGTWFDGTNSTGGSICYAHSVFFNVWGDLGETDNGASHTLDGGEDDSPNHTSCLFG